MNFEITGKLAVKYDTQQVKENFRKREFVLEISEDVNGNTYTNYAKMQLVQDKCDLLNNYNIGDLVKVNFSIRGNRWEKDGKVNYITNLGAWRIEPASMQNPQTQYAQSAPAYVNGQNAAPALSGSSENADDLPF